MPDAPHISIIIPCHNEESVLTVLFERLVTALKPLAMTYEVLCINDGSTDNTLVMLHQLQKQHDTLTIIDLSRNFGKEAALSAGLDHAKGQAVILLDADLQDPPEEIPRMIAAWQNGHDVVLMHRQQRDSDSALKKLTATGFYRLHNRLTKTKIPENVGDFRLLDRKVVDIVTSLPERQRFMKGLLSWPGFQHTTLEYTRPERHSGKSSWNYWQLWNFALDGITAFSTAPLRLWTYIGVAVSLGALIYAIVIISVTLWQGTSVPGYASLMVVILFLGGIQLISLGVIGEYIGRIHTEVKQRPLYVVRKILPSPNTQSTTDGKS